MQTVSTPAARNVSIPYVIAPVGTRIGAFLLDSVLVVIYLIMVSSAFISMDVEEEWVWMVFVGIPMFGFGVICELLMGGQTPGKRITNIRVMRLDGTAPKSADYLLRWACGLIDFIFFLGIIAILIITARGKGQRLGDIVAGTFVVRSSPDSSAMRTQSGTHMDTPAFPQVVQLDRYYIELIERALEANRSHGNPVPVSMMSEKVKSLLNIRTEMQPVQFLKTLVKDFNSLNAR
jgi:uncharacterized RDD family membrane protein YckC